MWRIPFLVVVLVGALAATIALIFGMGVMRASKLQAAATPATQPVAVAAAAPSPSPSAESAGVNESRPPQQPIAPPGVFRPRVVVDPPPREPRIGPPVVPLPPDPPKPLVLNVRDAVIRGDDLRVEGGDVKTTVNWQNRSDGLEWSTNVPSTGEYLVEMEYACDPLEGGGVFTLLASGRVRIMAGIRPTTGWQDYQNLEVAHIYLAAGPNEITIRPTFLAADHTLMNLRSMKITLVREMDEIPEGRSMRGRGFFRRFGE